MLIRSMHKDYNEQCDLTDIIYIFRDNFKPSLSLSKEVKIFLTSGQSG